jgi:hypothetical protein
MLTGHILQNDNRLNIRMTCPATTCNFCADISQLFTVSELLSVDYFQFLRYITRLFTVSVLSVDYFQFLCWY